MNILIVDGNDRESSNQYSELGMNTQYEEYANVLTQLSSTQLNIYVIHPTWEENFLKQGINLDEFSGVVWTGSVLNIYDMSPAITRQIELAKTLLQKNNTIFGSCWGLQVLVTAAGGIIHKNPKGLEAVISKDILLNYAGISHNMYINKPERFDSFCWHYDEVKKIPDDSIVLASNKFSTVQALTFKRGDSEVWGVQYHPEFSPFWVSGLVNMRKKVLLESNIFNNEETYNHMYNYLSDIKKNKLLEKNLNIQASLKDDSTRYIELINWLNNLKEKS